MRNATNGKYPRYIVWENVPGAFSSNGGEDFRYVLEAFCRIKNETVTIPRPAKWTGAGQILGDDFSFAWRIIDAQYFGVARDADACFLSQILMANVSEKYYLSPKACQGILRRASERGKQLPNILRIALERQAHIV